LRGKKLITADSACELLKYYEMVSPHRPEALAQEVIVGGDDAKYCYLSIYGRHSVRLGYCVVQEFRCYPIGFGSASIVKPVVDDEIARICDEFLRATGYEGLCEIEVKRDARDGKIQLIEVNPRYSGTGDCSIYTGVDVGWLHYLDLIGETVHAVEASRLGFMHITLRRDLPTFPQYLQSGLTGWREWFRAYHGPVEFFDLDGRDLRVTAGTLAYCLRRFAGGLVRHWRSQMTTRPASDKAAGQGRSWPAGELGRRHNDQNC
jgi:predicted ATP-grasp superfamily ATP-dependent carboligase